VILLIALAAAACGNAPSTVVNGNAEELLTCAGPPFSANVFQTAADAVEVEAPENDALRAALESDPFQPDDRNRPWRLLGRTETEVAFGAGDPPLLGGYVVLRSDGDSWRYAQSGSNCLVRPHREGRTLARWGHDPAGPEVSSATSTLHLIVNDEPCASGIGPDERLDDPIIKSTPTALTITFTSRPPPGDQNCPSHPPARRLVTLPEPLGDRELRDGGIFPPQPPCRIDRNDCANDREVIGNS